MINTKLITCPTCKGKGENLGAPLMSGYEINTCTKCLGAGTIEDEVEPNEPVQPDTDSTYRHDRHDKDFDEDI